MTEPGRDSPAKRLPRPALVPDLELTLDRRAATPLYRQIADGVRRGIADGALPLAGRLPPERTLAAALAVDRTTVVAAYRELAAEGLVSAHVGRGTTVCAPRLGGRPTTVPVQPLSWEQSFTRTIDDDPVLDELASFATRPDVISFAAGIPAPEHYPTADIRQLLDEALGDEGKGLLQYCPVEGFAPLRAAIATRMTARGAAVRPEQVLVCSGSQQGLYLLARALLEPGEMVGVEAPTYYGALQVFRAVGARIVTIPADRDGPDPDRLDALLSRRPIKLLYLLPTFQNPTGATLSLERRQRILAVARRHQIPVVEDDPYGELRYDGTPLPTLAQLDPGSGSVVYLSTFSKALFPGFRLGWIMAPPAVIARLAWMKGLVDLDSNPLAQWAVARYLERGLLDRHLDRVRRVYPQRRDALVTALAREAGHHLTWDLPDGGFYLWVRLAGGVRAREVLAEALAARVAFVPGDLYHADGGGRDAMRLAFSGLPPNVLDEGARRLAGAIRTVVERRALARTGPSPISTRIV